MTPFADLVQQSAANAWLFVPSAILLGALHGLEPGHSKTMMTAFIVAIRGTLGQAVLLGLSATLSHTAVVWAIALAGLHYGRVLDVEANEGWFQMGSAVPIVGIALWMMARTWREQRRAARHEHGHEHGHGHDHGHGHGDEIRRIDTGHGAVALEIVEDGAPPRFRLRFEDHGRSVPPPRGQAVALETERADGTRQSFALADRGAFLESVDAIPEPHAFIARLTLAHGDHRRDYDVEFSEHGHVHPEDHGLDVAAPGYQDAHERAHADDIRRRFASRSATTGQIVMFGLTGGLIPCPASITVLLLCLQLKQVGLGVVLVLCFSIGLALTMVGAGAAAALSVRHVSQRWSGFTTLARRAPYLSGALIVAVGLFVGVEGWMSLPRS